MNPRPRFALIGTCPHEKERNERNRLQSVKSKRVERKDISALTSHAAAN